MVSTIISSGVDCAERILKGTNIVESLFQSIILNKKQHGYTITGSIIKEFSKLLSVLANV